ncbi:MAG: signal peptide peptidase SppA [Ferroplasma sp.]|uniref:signal peptide peptidase SppA n=1 Tax=Ferroplasma sp. TaxID=2591003 RepID=UPI002814F67B|nr:signal peptide peptidase SppA [Ferroplasma sp.]WMT51665.1 MAG: signal peptide peptidase SppA [Ferroplasma sp.]
MYTAILNVNGTINRGMLNSYMPALKYMEKKNKVKGLLLVINSGGGDANSTEILYNQLLKISDKKPVYALIEGVGASGAYWLACSAEKIFAMRTSIVGSIGVISMSPDFSEFLENLGIKMRINKIGKYKDINSPFRAMTDEESKIYSSIMNDIYLAFREQVKIRRNFTDEKMDSIATGLVFSADQAKGEGLIDGIGNMDTVMDQFKERTGTGSIKNLTPKRPFVSRIMSMSMEALSGIVENIR